MGVYTLGHYDIGFKASFSGGTWRDNLDTDKLNAQLITAVSRTLDLTPLQLDITLDRSIDIQVLGIINHNMSSTAIYQWRCYSDAGRTNLVYDSGVINSFEYFDALHIKTTCDRADAPYDHAYWRLNITDDLNTDGYIQIGRLFMGLSFDATMCNAPRCNMDYGLKLGVLEDDTIITKSPSGIESYVDAPNKRTAVFSHSLVDYDTGDRFLENTVRDGIIGACLFEFDPEDKHKGLRTFIGRKQTLTPLDYAYFNINSISFSLIEII